jgi:branched-chain amino acid transport system substrate-binding protein
VVATVLIVTTRTSGQRSPNAAGPSGCGYKIGFAGPVTGSDAGRYDGLFKAVQLAWTQYNAHHLGCEVGLLSLDIPDKRDLASQRADAYTSNSSLLGVVGPLTPSEFEGAAPVLEAAHIPMITPIATDPALSGNHWTRFYRAVGTDADQGAAAARYIQDKFKPAKVFVVTDGSAYAQALTSPLHNVTIGTASIERGQADFGSVAAEIHSTEAKAVFFAGVDERAAGLLLKQLRAIGDDATLVGGDVLGGGFLKVADAAAEGTVRTSACVPPEEGKKSFVDDYREKYHSALDGCSGYAYDAANIFLNGIGTGVHDRASMYQYLNNNRYSGVMGKYKFTDKGDLDPNEVKIGVFTVRAGTFTYLDSVDVK